MENIVIIFLGKHVFRDSLLLEIDQVVNYIKEVIARRSLTEFKLRYIAFIKTFCNVASLIVIK